MIKARFEAEILIELRGLCTSRGFVHAISAIHLRDVMITALRARVDDFESHLELCARMNEVMIDYHQPKVIFQPGLGWLGEAKRLYNLEHVGTVPFGKRKRLIEHYETPGGTPWLCTPHWTASFGFSSAEMQEIARYAGALAKVSPSRSATSMLK